MEEDRGWNKKRLIPNQLLNIKPSFFDMPVPNSKEGRMNRIEKFLDSINCHLVKLEKNVDKNIDEIVERVGDENEGNLNEKLDRFEKNINEKLERIEERIVSLVNLLV